MPEPIAERLSRFTPDGAKLDRDALLFAAGRASVRPQRGWAILAGALAAAQVLTLVLLWPVPSAPVLSVTAGLPSTDAVERSAPLVSRDAPELGTLSQWVSQSPTGDLPPFVPSTGSIPFDDPPLYAAAACAPADLN